MGKIKYEVKAYEPTTNQIGTAGFYAQAVKNDDIHTLDLAKKIAGKTGIQSPMVEAVLKCVAAQIVEEILESNRVYLEDAEGNNMLTIYPKVTGSISQTMVNEGIAAGKYPASTVVSEGLLLPTMLKAGATASVGVKFNKLIDLNKSLQKVVAGSSQATPGTGDNDGNVDGDSQNTNPSGGGNNDEINDGD